MRSAGDCSCSRIAIVLIAGSSRVRRSLRSWPPISTGSRSRPARISSFPSSHPRASNASSAEPAAVTSSCARSTGRAWCLFGRARWMMTRRFGRRPTSGPASKLRGMRSVIRCHITPRACRRNSRLGGCSRRATTSPRSSRLRTQGTDSPYNPWVPARRRCWGPAHSAEHSRRSDGGDPGSR